MCSTASDPASAIAENENAMWEVRFELRNLLAATFWVALGLGALAMGDVRPNQWRPNLTDGVLLLFCL
jgi:hypothetical protein